MLKDLTVTNCGNLCNILTGTLMTRKRTREHRFIYYIIMNYIN